MAFDVSRISVVQTAVADPRESRWRQLARKYVMHTDRSAEDEAAFTAWIDARATGLVRLLGATMGALMLLTWPGDLRFRGEHQQVFEAFAIWRTIALVAIAPLAFVHRIPLLRRYPLQTALVAYVVFLLGVGYSLGRIGGLDSPWFYVLYGASWLLVIIPLRVYPRIAWTIVTTLAGALAYFLPHPEHLAHPHLAVPLVNAATFSAVGLLIGHIVQYLVRDNFFAHRDVDRERARAENLLLNVLPERIAQRLQKTPAPIGERFAQVTVMFVDVVEFTRLAARVSPEQLLRFLNDLFTRFDLIADRFGLEKIKTIGDAYLAAGGLPEPRDDHAEAIADMALAMRDSVRDLRDPLGQPLQLRIGIYTGPVVAGVIGVRKFSYDLWGDTVNMASRLESHGLPGKIQIGPPTYQLLAGRYLCEPRGPTTIKGAGEMETWFLVGKVS